MIAMDTSARTNALHAWARTQIGGPEPGRLLSNSPAKLTPKRS